MVAASSSAKVLSSGEEDYFDDSEAEEEKVCNQKRNKKYQRETSESITARSKGWRQSLENKKNISVPSDDSRGRRISTS